MMPALKDIQSTFKNYLMHSDATIAEHIVSTQELGHDLRLAIYSNAYTSRLIEALQQDYEILHALLGDEQFADLAQRYIEYYPSRFYSLRWFGQYMAQFIADTAPYDDQPFLREMAVFEWSFINAFDAEDVSIVTEHEAAQIPPESWPGLGIQFHPSLQIFEYHWNILPVWKAIKNDNTVPAVTRLDTPNHCAVWRYDLKTHFRTVESLEAQLMLLVTEGGDFAQLCEFLMSLSPDNSGVAMQAAGYLRTWINQGIVTGLLY